MVQVVHYHLYPSRFRCPHIFLALPPPFSFSFLFVTLEFIDITKSHLHQLVRTRGARLPPAQHRHTTMAHSSSRRLMELSSSITPANKPPSTSTVWPSLIVAWVSVTTGPPLPCPTYGHQHAHQCSWRERYFPPLPNVLDQYHLYGKTIQHIISLYAPLLPFSHYSLYICLSLLVSSSC